MTDSENKTLHVPQSRSTAGLGVRDGIAIQREYINAIKPYLDMKYRVYCVTLPKTTINPDGKIEHEYDFTDEQKETLRLVDEGIEMVKRRLGVTPNAELTRLAEGQSA